MLKVRLEMAKFLQETIAETGIPGEDSAKSAKEFTDFFRKVCSQVDERTLNISMRW